MTKTKFYEVLKNAVTDDIALVTVINKIMPMIIKLSKDNNEVDEELKSELVVYSIEIIRKKKIFKIF